MERGEAVHGRDGLKPVGFGDFLILVRKRDALFEEVIRALKQAGVPVAGADRLTLSDHIVFDDLTGLVRWVLYPKDELTLAALLRSPFCSVSEASLFDLAYGREGDLWSVLDRRADERPEWREARDFLGWVGERARRRTPFDFLGEVLNRRDANGRSMRAALPREARPRGGGGDRRASWPRRWPPRAAGRATWRVCWRRWPRPRWWSSARWRRPATRCG